jgi:hypothetical protein
MADVITESALPASLQQIFRKVITQLSGRGDGDVVMPSGGGGGGQGGGSGRSYKRERDEADDRRKDRRERDRRKSQGSGGQESREARLRGGAYLCYAFSFHSGRWYVGYSGGGGQFSNALASDRDLGRRNHRVEPYLVQVVPAQDLDRPVNNCAEVSALSVAVAHGEPVNMLLFITWTGGNRGGNLVNPCANCIQWIQQYTYGYIGADAQFHAGNGGGH